MIDKNKYGHSDLNIFITFILFFLSLFGGSFLGVQVNTIIFSYYRIFLVISFFFLIVNNKLKILVSKRSVPHLYISFLIFWFVISLIQIGFTRDLNASIKYLLVLFSAIVITYQAIQYVDNDFMLKLVLNALTLATVIIILFSFYEMMTGNYFNLTGERNILYYSTSRNPFKLYIPIAYLGNPNNLGMFCVMITPFIISNYRMTTNIIYRFIILTIVISLIIIIIGSESRAALLSIVIFFSMILFIRLRIPNSYKMLIGLCLLVIVALIALLIFDFKGYFTSVVSNVIRLNLLINGLEILIVKSFGLGVGLGNIESYMALYNNTSGVTNIHFWFFEVLVSGGIIIFTIYIYVYIYMLKNLFKIVKQASHNHYKSVATYFIAFMISFVFASIGPSSSFQLDFMWSMFAVLAAFIGIVNKQEKKLYQGG